MTSSDRGSTRSPDRSLHIDGNPYQLPLTAVLGESFPDQVIGIHVNMPTVPLPRPDENSTEQERNSYQDFQTHTATGTGYQHIQSSRPQTLGYGLVDSPVAQLAWVVEKFWAWTDCDGDRNPVQSLASVRSPCPRDARSFPAKSGGHFAAFEQPALFVDEVRSSFRPLRKR